LKLFPAICCTDGKNEHGLKLEKFGPTEKLFFQGQFLMQCFAKITKKILWLVLSDKICFLSS